MLALPALLAALPLIGVPQAPRRALVVGCIHGNECAGIAVIRRLRPAGLGVGPQQGNHHFSRGASFAVELPAGPMTRAAVTRRVNAILTLVR